jgi:hypothetical protein
MDVGMMHEVLSPGVQHGKEAYLCAEVSGVGSNLVQCLRSSTEKDVVNHPLVLQRKAGDFLRDGENDMEVPDWQKL